MYCVTPVGQNLAGSGGDSAETSSNCILWSIYFFFLDTGTGSLHTLSWILTKSTKLVLCPYFIDEKTGCKTVKL